MNQKSSLREVPQFVSWVLTGNTGEVKDLRREATALKEVVADLTLENRLLKKSMSGDGEDEA